MTDDSEGREDLRSGLSEAIEAFTALRDSLPSLSPWYLRACIASARQALGTLDRALQIVAELARRTTEH
jgi:hypothetical protein